MAPVSASDVPVELAAAINAGALDAAAELWGEEAVIVGPDGGSVSGRTNIRGVLAALIEAGTRMEIELSSLREAGDVALATGTLTLLPQDGQPLSYASIVVYERSADDRWRVAIDAPAGMPRSGREDGRRGLEAAPRRRGTS